MSKHRKQAPIRDRVAVGAITGCMALLAVCAGTLGSPGVAQPALVEPRPAMAVFALPQVPMEITAAARRMHPLPAPAVETAPTERPLATERAETPSIAGRAVNAAMSLRGVSYRWGGTGRGGVDCSGLILYAYRAAGVSLPRTAASQANVGRSVPLSALRPGDLIFYYSPVSHVVMSLGNGKVIEVSRPGTVVHTVPIYLQGFAGARRIVS